MSKCVTYTFSVILLIFLWAHRDCVAQIEPFYEGEKSGSHRVERQQKTGPCRCRGRVSYFAGSVEKAILTPIVMTGMVNNAFGEFVHQSGTVFKQGIIADGKKFDDALGGIAANAYRLWWQRDRFITAHDLEGFPVEASIYKVPFVGCVVSATVTNFISLFVVIEVRNCNSGLRNTGDVRIVIFSIEQSREDYDEICDVGQIADIYFRMIAPCVFPRSSFQSERSGTLPLQECL